jgi:hypothetical protein
VKPRIYIETTIPSYLTARPNRDLVIAGHQQSTRDWWATDRQRFDLFVSRFVIDEVAAGDPEAARARLDSLIGIPELPATEHALELATALVVEGAVPENARIDAAHIANAEKEPHIRKVCLSHGWHCPVICSPEQLMLPESEETP